MENKKFKEAVRNIEKMLEDISSNISSFEESFRGSLKEIGDKLESSKTLLKEVAQFF